MLERSWQTGLNKYVYNSEITFLQRNVTDTSYVVTNVKLK